MLEHFVWSANAFAVLGLRQLYFMLAGMVDRFVYLQVGLSIVLVFVGAKFLVSDIVAKVPVTFSLPLITTVALVSILASLWRTRQKRPDKFGSPTERQWVE